MVSEGSYGISNEHQQQMKFVQQLISTLDINQQLLVFHSLDLVGNKLIMLELTAWLRTTNYFGLVPIGFPVHYSL